jgi:hypothetical protein
METVTLTLIILAGITLFVWVPAILLTSRWAIRKD